jgi:anti-sigma B factor antagonist
MRIDTRTSDGITVLDVHGRITIGEGSVEMRNKLRELMQAGKKDIPSGRCQLCRQFSGIGELVIAIRQSPTRAAAVASSQESSELLAITKLVPFRLTFIKGG